jgi:Holliday junction resolvase RusA-like endonuclease
MPNEITIEIEPVPQPRHRITSIGGRARTYLPTRHPVHEYKRRIAEAVKDWPKYEKGVPLSLELWFWLEMPASWSKRKQAVNVFKAHAQKPDIDNLTKAVMDAMSERVEKLTEATREIMKLAGVWQDDCQVADLTVRKRWGGIGESGRVLISLEAINDEE